MKRRFMTLVAAAAAVVLAAGTVSCDKGGSENTDNDELYKSILKSYVNTTVVPTYKALAEAALEMRTANAALKLENGKTDAAITAAANAWMKARIEWELSEAFLFGPVGAEQMDIDGHIDSWPLEINEILDEVEKIEKGATLDGKAAWDMDAEVIGFHVTEYLLWREGQPRKAADVTDAELEYLTAATDALVWDCVLAYVAWVGEDNVTAEMKSVFNENSKVVAHLNNNANCKDFANKLVSGVGYASMTEALSEIAAGAADIADEVGMTKIESPYISDNGSGGKGKVEDVESWYSWHSLDDYTNNIKSIKNAYLGGRDDNSRTSVNLSSYIVTVNPKLDADIKAKIEDCITKIQGMGKGNKSFYEVVRDQINKDEVEAAVDACGDLADLFTTAISAIE